ncbi:MAG: SpoIVB peptidase S55 domain-containing protein [Clostridia bacterium]|nr:SpoIVB peptidase S55 domain-containing protein [Clostridia bacterium]
METENQADVQMGDIILEVNNTSIESNRELVEYVQKSEGKSIKLKIDRNGKKKNVTVDPKYSEKSKTFELGIWVKDSSAGVGTISFYDKKSNTFASLGHGITETSNNIILPINTGGIVKTRVTNIKKGESRNPGDIKGVLYTDVLRTNS